MIYSNLGLNITIVKQINYLSVLFPFGRICNPTAFEYKDLQSEISAL